LTNNRRIYIRDGAEETLREAAKLIFDFDGVLVQTSDSYRQTIRKVVDYYFFELLGLEGRAGTLATLRDIQKFKDTGLYNNDWKLTYAFIRYYLTLIIRELEQKNALKQFKQHFSALSFSNLQSFIQSLRKVGDFLEHLNITGTELAEQKDSGITKLDLFLTQDRLEKPMPTEISLVGVDPKVAANEELIRRLAPYDLEKPDLVKRLFEEAYLGRELFTKLYGMASFFNFEEGFLDKEQFIPSRDVMETLSRRFGKFGIYSGRPRPQGDYILKKYNYTEYFEEAESVFLGDLLKSEAEMQRLGKPNPSLFVELVKKLDNPKGRVAYVGDGVADAMLIQNSKAQGIENLCFIGVASSSEDSNKLFTEYINHGADAVVTDVNDLPTLFACLEGRV